MQQQDAQGYLRDQMQGTRPIPGGGIEALIGVVIRTFDGAGNFSQVDNIKGATSSIGFSTDSVPVLIA